VPCHEVDNGLSLNLTKYQQTHKVKLSLRRPIFSLCQSIQSNDPLQRNGLAEGVVGVNTQ